MTPGEAEEGFKVTDRRGRTEPESPRPAVAAPPPPAAPAALGPSREAAGDERSLVGLFMMLASSAVVALGEVPDPVTGQRHPDPAQAAELIDLLALLRLLLDPVALRALAWPLPDGVGSVRIETGRAVIRPAS